MKKVYKSSVVIIPPESQWEQIQEIRRYGLVLDSTRTFSSAWSCQQSLCCRYEGGGVHLSIVYCPSVRHLYLDWITSRPVERMSVNLNCGLPWTMCPVFSNFLRFFFVNLGPCGSENFEMLLLLQITFEYYIKLFLIFFLGGPHIRFLYFWNFAKISLIDFSPIFNMGPYGSENFKMLLLVYDS